MDENANEIKNNESISCTNCGKENNISNKVCIFCGTPIVCNTVTNKDVQPTNNNINMNQSTTIEQTTESKEQTIDVKKEEIPKEEKIICPACGSSNDKSHNFCMQCGQDLNSTKIKSNNNQTKTKGILTIITIVLLYLSYINPYFIPLLIILSIAALFKKETRSYGKGILITLGSTFLMGMLFFIILLGMCAVMIGG